VLSLKAVDMITVLVVEDSLTQREIIREILEKIGLKIICAVNGIEALSLIESHCPKVVILDIVMPQMNGYEVCRRLKTNNFTQKPAVVMYSTKSEKCDFYWGSKQGADAYVSKLWHPHALVNTVKQLLQKADNNQEANMTSMAKQQSDLIAQIKQLYSNLRVYKKRLANTSGWGDTKDLALVVKQIETQIEELEAQLDALFAFDGTARTSTSI
jgi:twitching motility two-component system response regulator PilH